MLDAVLGTTMALGGLLGRQGGDGGAAGYLRMAYDEFGRLRPPTPEEMQVQLEDLIQQGVVTPEEAQYIAQNPTAFMDVEENPAVMKAQMGALAKLQGISNAGGMDAQGKARLADVINQFETSAKGANEAIMENAAQRGVSGSGLEMANRMIGTQEAAGRANVGALNTAAEAEKRALESIVQSGQLSGDIRSQDYRKSSDKAAAVDAINRFNTANRQDVLNTNVANRNRAQELNLGEKQRLAEANVMQRNQNALRNSNLRQTDFENKYKIAAGKAGQAGAMAQNAADTRAKDDAFYANLLGTGGTILGNSSWGSPTSSNGMVSTEQDDKKKRYV